MVGAIVCVEPRLTMWTLETMRVEYVSQRIVPNLLLSNPYSAVIDISIMACTLANPIGLPTMINNVEKSSEFEMKLMITIF